jgi:3-dehydroquinate dehydratase/shikimate dehydrogenase
VRELPKLCVSITEPTLARARAGARRASAAGAFAELRIDCLEDVDLSDAGALAEFFEGVGGSAILTCRRPEDGGRRRVDELMRVTFLVDAARRFGCLCDLELDLAANFEALGVDAERLVLSHHDFDATPRDFAPLYEAMTRVPAAVYKVATFASGTDDLVSLARLLARASSDGHRFVAIAMGSKGVATRVLGPAHGAAFTFCALERGNEAAPGQATLDEMTRLYRADRLGPLCEVYGLAGGRVDYSLSPVIHNTAFREDCADAVYIPFEVDAIDRFLSDVVRPDTRRVPWRVLGLSVTNPFKSDVIGHLDFVDPIAARVESVNTIVVRDGELHGFNTDVAGAVVPLESALGNLEGLNAAVVGAGGAARAVAFGLVERGARVTVYARREERARGVAQSLGCDGRSLDEIADARPDLLVNTTPLGTRGPHEGESPVPADALRGIGLVYDLVYNPAETRLLADARVRGCATLNGLPMLVEQAAGQFEIWTGKPAPRAVMQSAVGSR